MLRAGIPFLADVLRVLIVLAFYLVLRVLFIDTYADPRPDDFARIVWGGFRFDLLSIAYLSLPYLIIRFFWQQESGLMATMTKWVFIIPHSIALFMCCLDLEYYAFSKRRTTIDYFDFANGGGDFWNLLSSIFPDFLLTAVILLVMIILLFSGYRKIGLILYPEKTAIGPRIAVSALALLLIYAGVRGGFQLKPINNLSAGQYTIPERYDMVTNTPFTILQSLATTELEQVEYHSASDLEQLWPVQHRMVKDPADLVGYNVVLLILESFSADMSGVLSTNASQMPFLDSLMQKSIYFERAYANGTRSVDAVPALIASVPQLTQQAFIYSAYANTQFTSLPNLLKRKNYSSAFFHGGRNGTMGFEDFSAVVGFDDYIGLDQYPQDQEAHLGDWGVHDGPFLQFVAQELNTMQQPFFATVFTLSSHHPYDIPHDADDYLHGIENRLHRSIRYADNSLRSFFNTARTLDSYDSTLFIITADHTAESGLAKSVQAKYRVPLIIHIPKKNVAFKSDKVIQHIDVLPMTLDFLGYEKPFFSFGQDLRGTKEGAAVLREGDVYQYISHEGVLTLDGENILGAENKAGQAMPLPDKITKRYFSRAQACIQQFNKRVNDRELVIHE